MKFEMVYSYWEKHPRYLKTRLNEGDPLKFVLTIVVIALLYLSFMLYKKRAK